VTLRMRAVSHSVIDAPAAGVKAAGRGAQPSRGRHKTAIATFVLAATLAGAASFA